MMTPVLVFELCDDGDLGGVLAKNRGGAYILTPRDIVVWCAEIAAGMTHLHEAGVSDDANI